MTDTPFEDFGKIARLTREIVVTEKIDGTNACVYIGEGVVIYHTAAKTLFKKTIEKDAEWKGKAA